jgi:septal ring factor EnvC (AmiA/AmiB activator)
VEECLPCPVFASFTLAFALQLRKKARKNLSQGKKNLSQVKKNLSQVKKNLSQVKKNLSHSTSQSYIKHHTIFLKKS